MLRLVAGLEAPTEGTILADRAPGHRPRPFTGHRLQDPTLYPWRTVWKNAALGLEARGLLRAHALKVDAALDLVGLKSFAGALPHQLSGGMAQRAALARALVNDPRLLILDEPLGKLDSLTRLTMQKELVRLCRRAGFTVLLVTHDVEEALYLADRVVVLSNRPARIEDVVQVELPHPRRRDAQEFVSSETAGCSTGSASTTSSARAQRPSRGTSRKTSRISVFRLACARRAFEQGAHHCDDTRRGAGQRSTGC